jgi:hypothetical protein
MFPFHKLMELIPIFIRVLHRFFLQCSVDFHHLPVEEIVVVVVQWNASITKSCGWRNYIRYNEISLHWNTLKRQTCLHRRFSRAAVIELNESRGLCARLYWSIWVARPLNSWPKPKLTMSTLPLVISIPFCRNRDERAGECSYVPSNNLQSWECGCLHRRFTRAATIGSNERSLSTSVESKRSPIDRNETWRRSTQIDQCKCFFSTWVKSKRSLIDYVETRVQLSLLVLWLKSCDRPM